LKSLSTLLRKNVMKRLLKSQMYLKYLRLSLQLKKMHLSTMKMSLMPNLKPKNMEQMMLKKNPLLMNPLKPMVVNLKALHPKSSERQFLKPVFSLCER
jgi:hypothetical protein